MTEPEEAKKEEQEYTKRKSISAVGVVTAFNALAYGLGPTHWPGRICLILAPVAVYFLPTMFARWGEKVEYNSEASDYQTYREELQKLHDQPGLSQEHKAELMKKIEELNLARSEQILKRAKRPPIQASDA
ncbi:hypothetical protein ACWEVY_28690 [Streptomyces longwoodensis]